MFNTYSGKAVDLWTFTEEMIDIEDLATGLANECRFAGQCWPHYSVAQHSVLVMELCPEEHRFQGLMHDIEEGYFKDLPTNIKHNPAMSAYKDFTERAREIILGHYGICPKISREVHKADKIALQIELANVTKRDLPRTPERMFVMALWQPAYARMMFRRAFQTLRKGEKWQDVLIPACCT